MPCSIGTGPSDTDGPDRLLWSQERTNVTKSRQPARVVVGKHDDTRLAVTANGHDGVNETTGAQSAFSAI